MPKAEIELETLAREVAAAHLGVRVERHDDGSLDSMPDAKIIHPDGRRDWLVHVRHDVQIRHPGRWLPRLLRATEEEPGGEEHRAGRSARSGSTGRITYAAPRHDGTRGRVTVR